MKHAKIGMALDERDHKKANKIVDRMLRDLSKAVSDLEKLGGGRAGVQNFGVHMMLKVAAHAAAHNAMRDGRAPRADYWDAVCKDALDKAEKDLSERAIDLVWRAVATLEGGNWVVKKAQDATVQP
jgi:hypothetical protein